MQAHGRCGGISGDVKYRDAMLAKGETDSREFPALGGGKYHATTQARPGLDRNSIFSTENKDDRADDLNG